MAVVLRDPDLHAHLVGPEVATTLERAREWMSDDCLGGEGDGALWHLRHLEEDPASPSVDRTLERLHASCPPALADRLQEALFVYRAVGRIVLPPLLPLSHRLLEAEMNLYSRLDEKKPYRDHLAHQTRVAALAHLLLVAGGAPGAGGLELPPALQWEQLRRGWSRSYELHLLRAHAQRRGLECPDPGLEGDPWEYVVRTAALLAGLAHDIGYVHKALGQVAEPVGLTFDHLVFPPECRLDASVDELPLGAMYRRVIAEVEHGQVHAPLDRFLERHYRELHSLVGALWLATVGERLRQQVRPLAETGPRVWQAELALQLAAMMAFAHDLGMSDRARRKLLGLRDEEGRDALRLETFPLSTLFTLADVLQEFGRPVRVVDENGVHFVVPVVGIRLDLAPRPELPVRDELDRLLWGLETATGKNDRRGDPVDTLRVKFCTRDGSKALLPDAAVQRRGLGGWREHFVAKGVRPWLQRAGLDRSVALDGEPEAVPELVERGKSLIALRRRLRKEGATPEVRRINAELGSLARLLGRREPRSEQQYGKLEEALDALLKDQSAELPHVAPLADVQEPAALVPDLARRTLVAIS